MKRKTQLLMGLPFLIILSLACTLSGIPTSTTPQEGNIIDTPKGVQALKLVGQPAFIQMDTTIDFTFMVENPNKDVAIQESLYTVTVRDSNGNVLGDPSERPLGTLLPGDRTAIVSLFGVDSGQTAAKVEIKLTPNSGSAKKVKVRAPVFSIKQQECISYPNDICVLTALLKNTLDKNLVYRMNSEVRIAGLAFDDKGNFLGENHVDLNYVPANSDVAFMIDFGFLKEKPARVDLYPMLNDLDVLDDQAASENLVSVADKNIIVDPTYNDFQGAFMVVNNDQKRVVKEIAYQITAYDENGVLFTIGGDVSCLLFPQEKTGIAIGLHGVPEGKKVSRYDIQVNSGEIYQGTLKAYPFKADQITFATDATPQIHGVINNLTGSNFNSIMEIDILAFDNNGKILAGGSTVDTFSMLANGSIPFEIYNLYPKLQGNDAKYEVYFYFDPFDFTP